jgi:hypothetical protein
MAPEQRVLLSRSEVCRLLSQEGLSLMLRKGAVERVEKPGQQWREVLTFISALCHFGQGSGAHEAHSKEAKVRWTNHMFGAVLECPNVTPDAEYSAARPSPCR